MLKPDKTFMLAAIEEAKKAAASGNYAAGAVVVKDSQVLSRAGNRIKTENDPVHHAEIVAIRIAAKLLGSRHLEGCILTQHMSHAPCAPLPQCGRR